MKNTVRWKAAIAVLALVITPVACGTGEGDTQADVDREMDLALAQGDSATLADLAKQEDERPADRPADSRTRAPAAAPAPARTPAPGPKFGDFTVAQGTRFQVTLDQELSTRNSAVGDLFTTTTVTPLVDGDRVVVPAGTKIRGEVTQAQASGGSGKPAILTVKFDSFTVDGKTYPIALTIAEATVETVGRDDTGDKVLKIGGGAAAGAIVGQLIGKNTGATLACAAVGAAAGTGLQMATQDVDAIIREGSQITVVTDAPVTVQKQID
ncbi:MAG: hypothetical protein ACWGON_10115 [Gemmatimonadota bacterium]